MTVRSFVTAALLLSGCQSVPLPPLTVVSKVELERFMGDWYVIANIPTFIEEGAHTADCGRRLPAHSGVRGKPGLRRIAHPQGPAALGH